MSWDDHDRERAFLPRTKPYTAAGIEPVPAPLATLTRDAAMGTTRVAEATDEDIARALRHRAGEAFSYGNDARAAELRKAADLVAGTVADDGP